MSNKLAKVNVENRGSRGVGAKTEGLSDEDLMSRYCREGLDSDFALLIARFEDEIYRYLVRYLGNKSLADDVFQDTFLQIHQKRHMYEQGRSVRPWIYSIANHQAIDTLRRVGRHPMQSLSASGNDSDGDAMRNSLESLLVSTADGPLSQLQSAERQVWVRKAIDSLPETLKQTIVLAYYQDMKYREIAEILDVPVGTVKSRLHSALLKLAERARADHVSNEDED